MKFFIAILLFLSSANVFAQKQNSYVLSVEDSLAIINELKEELKLMFGSEKKSFGDISAGVGSGFFRPSNLQQDSNLVSKAVYNLNGGYYHKSGIGLNARTLFLNDEGRFKMFQSAVSPSYNYLKHKAFAAGVNYTRYFYGDSLSFSTSPLVNEWQVYGRLKKVLLQPSITLNYAHGTYKEHIPQQGSDPSITITEKASDIGVMASIRHNFAWFKLFDKDDALVITPNLLTVAGTSKYGMNFAIGGVSPSFNLYNVKPKKKIKKKNSNGNGNGNGNGNNNGGGSTDPTVIEETYASNFQMQSATFILGAEYSWKKIYVEPQFLVDYSFVSSTNKWTNVFNVSIGITL